MQIATALRSAAAGILVLVAAAAGAADEPEAVYQKLHNATLAGNMDEMLKYASAAQRAEISGLPGRGTALKFLATMMPRSYAVNSKVLGPDGKTARILATGAHSVMGKTQPMYGAISLRKEAGEWKVDQWGWSNDKPDDESPAVSVPAPARAAKPKATAAPREPTLKHVETKGDCVFKPVMTDEDVARCRR